MFHKHGFVFALLDWQWSERSARKFYVTHSEDMGLGPPRARGAQTLMTAYFQSGLNGNQWEERFGEYQRQSEARKHASVTARTCAKRQRHQARARRQRQRTHVARSNLDTSC